MPLGENKGKVNMISTLTLTPTLRTAPISYEETHRGTANADLLDPSIIVVCN